MTAVLQTATTVAVQNAATAFEVVADAGALQQCVAARRPAVWRGLGAGFAAVENWGRPRSAFRTAADRQFEVFVSNQQAGLFYLDGTAHPAALLCASMRLSMTLRDFFADLPTLPVGFPGEGSWPALN